MIEDATNYRFSPWSKWAFFNVRHLMKEATGRVRGLCIVVLNVHDFYRIPKEFRLDVDIQIVKNAPSNSFDEDYYIKRIGSENVSWLHGIEDRWVSDPTLKRFGVWFSKNRKVGRLEIPFIERNNMTGLVWNDDPVLKPKLPTALPLTVPQKHGHGFLYNLSSLLIGAVFLILLVLFIAAL